MSSDIATLLSRLRGGRLLVIGDVLLDRYVRGEAERVSPEAPVLVLRVVDEEVRLGGAGGVAAFARALGAEVALAGVIGKDSAGMIVRSLGRDEVIDCRWLLEDESRPTPQKERFVAGTPGKAAESCSPAAGQQLLRVDREIRSDISSELVHQLVDCLAPAIDEADAILLSDYAKGTCVPKLLAAVIAAARSGSRMVPVLVDPGRGRELSLFAGATVIKPNREEAGRLWGAPVCSPNDATRAAEAIRISADVECVVVTLDSEGCVLSTERERVRHLPASPAWPRDITGAGDMFLAMMGVALANGLSLPESARLANVAAGLEVEQPGSTPLSVQTIKRSLAANISTRPSKILSLSELRMAIADHRFRGESVVFTNGCFDLLHPGHITMLAEAASMGDVLVVAVNDDSGLRRLKGPCRPVVGELDRARMLAALDCVTYVVVMTDETPHNLLHSLKPDVLVKGGTTAEIVGREIVEEYGGKVARTREAPGHSTTSLLDKLSSHSHAHVVPAS